MERRTININKVSYDILTKYCKDNTLKLNAWVEKLILNEISKKSGDGKNNQEEKL